MNKVRVPISYSKMILIFHYLRLAELVIKFVNINLFLELFSFLWIGIWYPKKNYKYVDNKIFLFLIN